jgi:hypothetical protein
VYPVITAPLLAGAVNATETDVEERALALTAVGAAGTAKPVAGNTAVTVIETASVLTALLLTLVAPATVKKLALTPLSVYPVAGTTVTVAVSTVSAAKVEPDGFHEIVELYWPLLTVLVTGVAPVAGIAIPEIEAIDTPAFGVVTEAEGAEALPVPTEFVAVTVNV